MQFMEILSLALDNLLSPPVLGFALGLVAVLVGGDLRLPDPVYQGLSMYLLLAMTEWTPTTCPVAPNEPL